MKIINYIVNNKDISKLKMIFFSYNISDKYVC